jgi:hypothetical protein
MKRSGIPQSGKGNLNVFVKTLVLWATSKN